MENRVWYSAAYACLKRYLNVILHSCSCYKVYGICIYTCVTGMEKMAGEYESWRAKSACRKELAGILDCMTRYSSIDSCRVINTGLDRFWYTKSFRQDVICKLSTRSIARSDAQYKSIYYITNTFMGHNVTFGSLDRPGCNGHHRPIFERLFYKAVYI